MSEIKDATTDEMMRFVANTGLTIARNEALEEAAAIVDGSPNHVHATHIIRRQKRHVSTWPGSERGERDRFKAIEQAYMSVKEQYSEIARIIGFSGDPFFGDPRAKHDLIVRRARSLADLAAHLPPPQEDE